MVKQPEQHRTIKIVGIVIVSVILLGILFEIAITAGSTNQTTGSKADLNASVGTTADGISITNNESSSWTGCYVGVNGGCGFNFNSPPYQTQIESIISPGQTSMVPYGSMTSNDGTRFDIQTHAVNSVVVMCSMGTENKIDRSYCGSKN